MQKLNIVQMTQSSGIQGDEYAWVLCTDEKNGERWEKTNDIEEIADSIEAVFAEDDEEAFLKIREYYPEERNVPFTSLKKGSQYSYNGKISWGEYRKEQKSIQWIKRTKDIKLLEDATYEDLAKYLEKSGDSLILSNLKELVHTNPYYEELWEEALTERSKLYDLGIAFNINKGIVEYNPRKAIQQKRQLFARYKRRKKVTRRLLIGDITDLAHSMRRHLADYTNIQHAWWEVRPSYGTQLGANTVHTPITVYATIFNHVYGKGSYRNLPYWQTVKELWKTLTPYKKGKLDYNFVEWIEAEFKKPRTRADIYNTKKGTPLSY